MSSGIRVAAPSVMAELANRELRWMQKLIKLQYRKIH
jgi:hypothetical protein